MIIQIRRTWWFAKFFAPSSTFPNNLFTRRTCDIHIIIIAILMAFPTCNVDGGEDVQRIVHDDDADGAEGDDDNDDDDDDDDDNGVVTSLANLTHLLSVSRASSKLFGFANGVFAVTF